jgi:hypothetical protein
MLQLLWKVKALQEETLSGHGPQMGAVGFSPTFVNPGILAEAGWLHVWSGTSSSERATLLQDLLTAWFAQIKQFTAQQYYQGKWANANDNPQKLASQVTFGGQVWYMLPRFRNWGVSSTLVNQVSAWAATVWPLGNWAANNAATCDPTNSLCTSD